MDFQDNPIQEKSIPWKHFTIIVVGLLLALGLVFGTRFFLQKKPTVTTAQKTSVQEQVIEKEAAIDACQNAENKEGCRIQVIKNAAIIEKSSAACASLKDVEKDDCLWSVAREGKDVKICEMISVHDNAVNCSDFIYARIATETNNPSMCAKIKEEDLKNGCQKAVEGPVTSANCVERKQDPAFCEMLEVTDQANAKQDREVCNALKDGRVDACKARVLLDDPDRDGLDTTQETVVHHTDPRKADTDGDGYNDGDEVKTGHDPLKK